MDRNRLARTLAIFAAVVCLGGILSLHYSTTAEAALLDNMVACWSLEEASGTRNDSVGSNHLTDNNTVLSSAGVVGDAALFVKSNTEYLSRASNASLQSGDIDFMMVLWVYPETLPPESEGYHLVSKFLGSTNEYTLSINASVDKFKLDYGSGALQSSVALSADTWYFVVAWHDSVNNQLGIQINNGTPETTSYSGGATAGNSPFYLSLLTAPNVGEHDGLLDEVGLWKRLLTSDERTELYNSGSGRSCDYILNPPTPTPTATPTATATPTPLPGTPDPDIYDTFTLTTSGNAARVSREVSYGEIGIVVALLLLTGSVTIGLYMVVTKQWLK